MTSRRRFFLDTNIFVYTFDDSSPERQMKAQELVETALTTGDGVISHQVVQEFLNVATTKFAVPLTAQDARSYLERVLAPLWRVYPTPELYARALATRQASGFGFYDSLIVAAAVDAECAILYTEDMQDGRVIDGVKVVDPF